MTETYSWTHVRDEASRVFGNSPNQEQEAAILQAFLRDPAEVVRVLGEVGAAVVAGRVTGGWPFVRTHLAREKPADTVATDESKRETIRRCALAWVTNVGAVYDQEAEVRSELFGEHGRFKRWPELEPEVLEEWRRAQAPA